MNKLTPAQQAAAVTQNLLQAYDRITLEQHRTGDAHAVNEDGLRVSPLAESAVAFCSVGTLIRQLNGSVQCGSYKTAQLVNCVLRSDEYNFLLEAASHYGFDSVTDFHVKAKEDTFHKVWMAAVLLSKEVH